MKRITTTVLIATALILPLSMVSSPPAAARVFVGISVGYAPPPLVWYPQPICPGYGYYWVPGYWAWGSYGYYWVPGAWVWPPRIGFYWTPGYWGWRAGYYWWHRGYWGPRIGFYGGIDYGYGYTGRGYRGGYWHHGRFYYNRAAVNVRRINIRFTYHRPVTRIREVRRVSYNGGRGGIALRPTAREQAWAHERHVRLTAMQRHLRERAQRDPELRFSRNHGRPPAAAGYGIFRDHIRRARPLPPGHMPPRRPRDSMPMQRPPRPTREFVQPSRHERPTRTPRGERREHQRPDAPRPPWHHGKHRSPVY